jgi:hypothetical protein
VADWSGSPPAGSCQAAPLPAETMVPTVPMVPRASKTSLYGLVRRRELREAGLRFLRPGWLPASGPSHSMVPTQTSAGHRRGRALADPRLRQLGVGERSPSSGGALAPSKAQPVVVRGIASHRSSASVTAVVPARSSKATAGKIVHFCSACFRFPLTNRPLS